MCAILYKRFEYNFDIYELLKCQFKTTRLQECDVS